MMTVTVTDRAEFGLKVLGGQDGGHVPADQRWGEGVVHHHCSRPDVHTNGRLCVLGRGYQRRKIYLGRGSVVTPEGVVVRRAVYLDGNLGAPGCALAARGAGAES